MGAFDQAANIVIPDDEGDPVGAKLFRRKWRWDQHEIVILRGVFVAGDQDAVSNAALVSDKKGNAVYAAGTGRLRMLERMIVDWTLAQNGRKVDVTPQNIKRLPTNYTQPLLDRCDELAGAMSEEEQEVFFSSANGLSRTSLEEMNLSQKPS
jgi:hypothetical protein